MTVFPIVERWRQPKPVGKTIKHLPSYCTLKSSADVGAVDLHGAGNGNFGRTESPSHSALAIDSAAARTAFGNSIRDVETMTRPETKNYPESHDQQEHGHPKNVTRTNTPGLSYYSSLAAGRHVRREKVGEKVVETKKKNGDVKRRTVILFKYVDSQTGQEITDETELARFRKYASPFVTEAILSYDPNATIQATFIAPNGKAKSVYSKAHDAQSLAEKYTRLKEFNRALPKIRRQIKADLESTDPKVRETAAVLYLIDQTGFRVGSTTDTVGKVQTYGASTLLNKHVKVDGNKVSFDFIGKKGVRIKKTVRDDKLAAIVNERKTAEWSQPLFATHYGAVMSYLKDIGGDFKVHDFRTWNGTVVALKQIRKRQGPASSEKVFNKWQREVCEKVGKHLGNAWTQARDSYVDPHVWDVWRKPEWGSWFPKKLKSEAADDDRRN